ncbi:MAG: cytidylate kinase-like family protein [Clostridium butyricum]|nr:cytidylate kinase-like family protein [Clostridium butyricum]
MNNIIITIDRQYGSGGRKIGEKLANKLGFAFYDRALLKRASEESGLHEDMFKNAEKRATSLFALSLSSSPYSMSMDDEVFIAQSKTVKKVAEEGNCVIVGACADYVLQDNPYCINIFIHSEIEKRKLRAINEYKMPEKNIEKTITRLDKCRSTYYVHYTDRKWGKAQNYDLTLDSGIGVDNTVELIETYIKMKTKNKV